LIVQEYLPGGSLKGYLDKNTLSLAKACKYALDIICGMKYLHSKNVIHRDLKSENILLDEQCNKCKIADFGISQFSDGSVMTMQSRGTLRWMAPEVISKGLVDKKADVYSFGILLFELLTSKLPYSNQPDSVIKNLEVYVTSGLRPSDDRIPLQWQKLLDRCWNKDPKERPSFSEIETQINLEYY